MLTYAAFKKCIGMVHQLESAEKQVLKVFEVKRVPDCLKLLKLIVGDLIETVVSVYAPNLVLPKYFLRRSNQCPV